MIRFALRCEKGHDFESWFRSGEAFETLRASGMVTCDHCGATRVEKSLMTPTVGKTRGDGPDRAVAGGASPAGAASDGGMQPAEADSPLAARPGTREHALNELRRKIEASSDYVGMRFAAEARAMHEGDAPARPIHGEARIDEARRLIEDGVPVAPLPFRPKRHMN